jgi:hypothetical protein
MEAYQQRVVSEKSDLDEKTAKLGEFIKSDKFDELPEDERERLARQHDCMEEYSEVLGERITAFKS